jgi:outer membrane protein insertion porin family
LQATVPIKAGEAFSPTAAREGAQRIRDYYTARGYLDARPELSIVDLPDDRVRLIYSVSEGERALVGEITVTGHTITQENSIRRFLNFRPGDVLTPELLRRTQRDLYATGAFREVNIRTEPINSDSPRRVIVNVTEAKPLLLVYGLGYSTDDGPRVLGQLTHTNLFGRANSATLKLRGSRREQLGQFQFTDLRPFGHNWPTTFSVFYNRNADLRPFVRRRLVGGRVEEDSPGRSFGIHRFAAFIQTERKLSEQTSLRFRYNFENAKLFNLENIPDIEVTRNERATRLGMFSAGISRDTRDSALNPTRGQLISADHSLAARIFGGNESFNKFFGNFQRYETLPSSLPLLGNSVIAVSARIGLAAAFKVTDRDGDSVITEPEQRLPISERFFAGGATTLRGFRFEEAGPQGILEPRQANELPTLVPLGGDALTVFNFELRYPLTERLRLVPFYDLGNVFRRVRDISFSRMTNTVGLGLRFNTPIGPIGVDYGYLLDPPSFVTASGGVIRQSRGVLHIRFGQSF